jgi:Domain of unknown function (DUF4157)
MSPITRYTLCLRDRASGYVRAVEGLRPAQRPACEGVTNPGFGGVAAAVARLRHGPGLSSVIVQAITGDGCHPFATTSTVVALLAGLTSAPLMWDAGLERAERRWGHVGGVPERMVVRARPAAVPVPAPMRRPLIGPSTDPAEREADCIAGRVLAMGAVPPVSTAVPGGPGGRPLSAAERAFFEPRFGHDFSRVRVHDDSTARKSAGALGARAYTAGEHIVMGVRPTADAMENVRLLAHELTSASARTACSPGSGRRWSGPQPGSPRT